MTRLTSTGFDRSRLDERLAALQSSMREIFGEDIDLDPDTIDGQTLGIFAESVSNLDQLAEDIYHSFNPNSATSAALSRLVQLNGIRRIGGTYSTVDILCVGQQGTLIPAGSSVSSSATKAVFKTLADATIDASGEVLVSCKASELGAKIGPANTVTKINSPVYGWQTANNTVAAVVGRDEETDEQLRTRRTRSTSTPAQAIVDALQGSVSNIPAVLQCEVYENNTGTVQAITGLPAHSVNVVVDGGATQDIADQMLTRMNIGVVQVGAVSVVANDSRGNPHTMKFDRPVDVNVKVILNVTKLAGWPTDGATRLQNALVAWTVANQKIGKNVIHSRLYDCLNAIPGHSITTMFIGTIPVPTLEDDITIAFNALARFSTANIVVNVT